MKISKLLLLLFTAMLVMSCQNTPETAPADMSIQGTEDGKVLLRFKPAVGQTMKMLMEINSEGAEIGNSQFALNFGLHSKDRQADLYQYELDIERIRVNTDLSGFKINYDSNLPAKGMEQALDQQIRPFLDNNIQLTMNERAQILEMDSKGFGQNMHMSKVDLNNMSIPLPQEPVGVGDTWSAKHQKDDEASEMQFRIARITQSEVFVELVPINESIEGDSTIINVSGSYVLDRATGFTKTGEIRNQVKTMGQNINNVVTFKQVN